MADLPDVNVWLALAYEAHEHHGRARAWFDGAESEQASFCRVTQMGLLRLLTIGAVMGPDVLDQERAWAAYDRLGSDGRIGFALEPSRLEPSWRRLTRESKPRPRAWTDAYLAAFAMAGGYRLVTFDSGLAAVRGLDSLELTES